VNSIRVPTRLGQLSQTHRSPERRKEDTLTGGKTRKDERSSFIEFVVRYPPAMERKKGKVEKGTKEIEHQRVKKW